MCRKLLLLIFIFIGMISIPEASSQRPKALLLLAKAVLEEMTDAPDSRYPSEMLKECVALGIFPSVKKGGYIVGGQLGKGVILYRGAKGNWSPPAFYSLYGGSIGFQIGIQEMDLIVMFMTEEAFQTVMEMGLTASLNLSATAGPVGRDLQKDPREPIYAYSRSKGLFAGVSLSGGKLDFHYKWSKVYYGDAYSSEMILLGNEIDQIPEEARSLVETVSRVTERG